MSPDEILIEYSSWQGACHERFVTLARRQTNSFSNRTSGRGHAGMSAWTVAFSRHRIPLGEGVLGFRRRRPLNEPTMISPVTLVVQALLALALLPEPRELPILEQSPLA